MCVIRSARACVWQEAAANQHAIAPPFPAETPRQIFIVVLVASPADLGFGVVDGRQQTPSRKRSPAHRAQHVAPALMRTRKPWGDNRQKHTGISKAHTSEARKTRDDTSRRGEQPALKRISRRMRPQQELRLQKLLARAYLRSTFCSEWCAVRSSCTERGRASGLGAPYAMSGPYSACFLNSISRKHIPITNCSELVFVFVFDLVEKHAFNAPGKRL